MMTSTFPTTRTNSQNLKNGIREIQHKKEALIALEAALKKRINEFRELCLKEGELTGHLPIDYPLQPREPIPQVRRRITRSNGNISNETTNGIAPPCSTRSRQQQPDQIATYAITTHSANLPFPSRPTSTNSSSSSASTTSSNARSINQALNNGHHYVNSVAPTASSRQSSNSDLRYPNNININSNPYIDKALSVCQRNIHPTPARFDPSILPSQLPKPSSFPAPSNFDSDTLAHVRASSTASSSISSGSAASSTVSTSAMPTNIKTLNGQTNNLNLHARSYSESITSGDQLALSSDRVLAGSQGNVQRQLLNQRANNFDHRLANETTDCPPSRPPRGQTHLISNTQARGFEAANGHVLSEKQETTPNGVNGLSAVKQTPIETPEGISKMININGVTSFQPYYEETKPFQMSDFYKYSSKHRQRIACDLNPKESLMNMVNNHTKTTRQLQDDVSKTKNSLKFASCDDQIQASVKLIEKSGQKLIEATAKAIAGNPGLAEKLNNILPNHHGERY